MERRLQLQVWVKYVDEVAHICHLVAVQRKEQGWETTSHLTLLVVAIAVMVAALVVETK